MGSQQKDKINIAIIGGGIAGLALGAGLAKKDHIDFHIYESVPEYKDVGAGLAVSTDINTSYVLDQCQS
jgi:salicylate hydroxylase